MEKAIYKITNLINGKVYIGQSIHPERRWIEHKQRARHGKEKSAIHLAIEKYGEENFSFEILKWSENYNKEEIDMIKKYNSLIPNGYNITEGGENCCVLRGEDNPRNTVPNNIISLIIQDLKNNKLTDRAIAKKYNLTDKIIADINHGYSHKQENENYPIRKKEEVKN
jgi:group I intron endonuclease